MKCPFCSNSETQVMDSRVSENGDSVKRRRKCLSCEKRFSTFETVEIKMPSVIKISGAREEFSLEKIQNGFSKALYRRPVNSLDIDSSISNIHNSIYNLGKREVDSNFIGQLVMNELIKLDKVAYIRFASVYKDFKDIDDFGTEINNIKSQD